MAHVTDLGFTMDELRNAIAIGDIRTQNHPEFPELIIANYCEEVQFRNRWNKITLACRGLILNVRTGEVVARPWEKFFNLGQMDNRIESNAPVEVTDKMDGSLGILYRRPDGELAIATRGSFASEQAIHATKVFNLIYKRHVYGPYADSNTCLFEIIYPDNRIVVNYEGMDDLVMLGSVHKQYGWYEGPVQAAGSLSWKGPQTEVFYADDFVSAISLPERKGMEGVVIRSGNKMVKLKQADYVELHRIVTNLSPKTVWEMLVQGKTASDICSQIPDEFHKYVEDIVDDLRAQFTGIKMSATIDFNQVKYKLWNGDPDANSISRRQWAMEIQKCDNPGLLFSLLDGKPIDDTIWKMIKPRGDVKSLVSEDA